MATQQALEARITESVTYARDRLNSLQAEMVAVQRREASFRADLQMRYDALAGQLALETERAAGESEARRHAEQAAAAANATLHQEAQRRSAIESEAHSLRLQYEAQLKQAQHAVAEVQRAASAASSQWSDDAARAQRLADSQLQAMQRRAERAEADSASVQRADGEFRREAEAQLEELRERLLALQRRTRTAELEAATAIEERERAVEAGRRQCEAEVARRQSIEAELAAVWDRVAKQVLHVTAMKRLCNGCVPGFGVTTPLLWRSCVITATLPWRCRRRSWRQRTRRELRPTTHSSRRRRRWTMCTPRSRSVSSTVVRSGPSAATRSCTVAPPPGFRWLERAVRSTGVARARVESEDAMLWKNKRE